MSVRLLETSLLVFFKKRTTKATIATAVAVSSLMIAQKYKPWLRDSDDKVGRCARRAPHPGLTRGSVHAQVAEVASWVLFLWIFALMAHDGLSNLHPLLWGYPLVLALFYLVGFAAHSCYKDFAELKKGLKADEEGEPENGDGLEATAADQADASLPGDDAPAWFDDAFSEE